MTGAFASTSDGTYNYLVEYNNLNVIETVRDFTNPMTLFSVSPMSQPSGITLRPGQPFSVDLASRLHPLTDYSLTGAVLSSFNVGHAMNEGLAFDPLDQTLWLVNNQTGNLEQYLTSGSPISLGLHVGESFGPSSTLIPLVSALVLSRAP